MDQNSRSQERQKTQQKQATQKQVKKDEKSITCESCKTINDAANSFCEECGQPLNTSICPNCNAVTYPGQDICEACVCWLLKLQCNFCYAGLDSDDEFCPECGNPVAGIVCYNCSTLSHFDFCPKCNTPLTQQALDEIEKAKNDKDLVAIKNLFEELEELKVEIEEVPRVSQEEIELQQQEEEKRKILRQLHSFYKQEETKPSPEKEKKAPPKTEIKKESKPKINLSQQIAERNSRRKKILQEIDEKLESLKNRTFNDSQQARRFFNANRPKGNYVWNCNYNNSLHPDPNNCGNAELGGRWVIEYGTIEWQIHHGEM